MTAPRHTPPIPRWRRAAGIGLGLVGGIWLAVALAFAVMFAADYVNSYNSCSDLATRSLTVPVVMGGAIGLPGFLACVAALRLLGRPPERVLARVGGGALLVAALITLAAAVWPKPGIPCTARMLLHLNMRYLVDAQQQFSDSARHYSASLEDLGYDVDSRIRITVDWATDSGWAGHIAFEDSVRSHMNRSATWTCGVIVGAGHGSSADLPASMRRDEVGCWDEEAPLKVRYGWR